MLSHLLLGYAFIIGCMLCDKLNAQEVDAALNLRIKPWDVGVYTGIFKDKIHSSPYKFSNSATLLDFSIPFYWVLLPKDQSLTKKINTPVLKIRPSIVTILLSTGSTALGISSNFSLKIVERLYLNYSLGFVWVMTQTKDGKGDGMKHGQNFLHFFSLEYSLQQNIHLTAGMTHISNGKILGNGIASSSSDALLVGIRYSFIDNTE